MKIDTKNKVTSHHHNGSNSKSTLLLKHRIKTKAISNTIFLDLFDELISNFPPFQTREVKESIYLHPRRTVSFCGRLSRIFSNSSHVLFFISSDFFICCSLFVLWSVDNHEHRLRSTIIIKSGTTSLVLPVQHHLRRQIRLVDIEKKKRSGERSVVDFVFLFRLVLRS